MSSPFLLALSDLDGSLKAAEAQLACLGASLPVNEELLVQVWQDACQRATALSDLVRAERPNAQWDDRTALDELVHELKTAAEAKRDQERRARLLELADALEAGRVKHRFQARTALLNALRLEAVHELRTQAALPEPTKELPGPDVSEWLIWAFNLQDDKDAAAVAELRAHFSVVERFTGEMEEIYWLPGQRTHQDSPPPPELPVRTGPVAHSPDEPVTAVSVAQRTQSDNVRDRVAGAMPGGANGDRAPAPHDTGETAVLVAAPEKARVSSTATPNIAPSSEAAVVPLAEKPYGAALQPAVEIPFASSQEVVEQPSPEAEKSLADADAIVRRKRFAVVWAGAAVFIVLSGLIFAVIYHLHARAGIKAAPTVEAATTMSASSTQGPDTPAEGAAAPTGAPTPRPPDASPTQPKTQSPLLHKLPAEGAQDSIVLSLELCGRGNPNNIECWGYVSNLGGQSSRVSLDRVDVVDGRGNSFSLDRNGQFAFPTGHSSDIPPGSRVKYTVKVPDKDLDARTLTLYMDLSNPRSLEYTFRNVPVAE